MTSTSGGPERFVIAGWILHEARHSLERDGEVVRLEPRTTQLLAYLARHPGEALSREELLREVWPGVVVSDEALTSAINKIRKAFGDQRERPEVIETIPKMGYRLIAPVRAAMPEPAPSPGEDAGRRQEELSPGDQPVPAKRFAVPILLAVVLAMGLAAGALLLVQYLGPKDAGVDVASSGESGGGAPSILVLPFRNISDSSDDDYFIDGMAEDIITDLSKLSNLLVIASQTALSLKGKDASAQDLGRELGVDYILDGSLRRAGPNLRINAQLIAVDSGFPLWAERYDRKVEKVFAIQDDIRSRIVEALSIRLTSQDKEALQEIAEVDFQAYDTFLRGRRSFNLRTEEGLREAEAAYREAIRLDPTFGRAFGALAVTLAVRYRRGWTEAPSETLDRALELARQAVAIDSSVPQVHWALSFVHLYRKEYAEAGRAVERSLSIAPNYADGYGLLALIHNNQGNAARAIEYITRAMQLNPYYSWDYPYNLGRAYYLSGKYEEAIPYLSEALERNNAALPPRLFLIATYVRQGLVDDAQWEVEQLRIENPELTISHVENAIPQTGEVVEIFVDDLRKAGLPE